MKKQGKKCCYINWLEDKRYFHKQNFSCTRVCMKEQRKTMQPLSGWLASQFDFNSTRSYVRFHCCQWQWLWYEKTCLCFSCPLRIQLNSRLWGDPWCPVLLPSCHVWSVSHWDSCLHFFLYADLPVTKVYIYIYI
jgi:hypothetical protein